VSHRPGESTPRFASAFATAVLLFGIALALRVAVAARLTVLFDDGPHFLGIARLFSLGDWRAAVADDYHPLYPLLVALAHGLLPDWERAAQAVSAVGGAAAVVALFAFARAAFDGRTAWIAGLLLAIHPYALAFSADVESEGLYMGLFTGSLACLWLGLERPRIAWAAAGGALAGLAYLTRPEGLGAVAIGAGTALFAVARGRIGARSGAAWLAAAGLGTGVVALPYVMALHSVTGEWRISQKKSLAQLASGAPLERQGLTPPRPPPAVPVDASAADVTPRPWSPPQPVAECASQAGHAAREALRRERWGAALASLHELVATAIGTFRLEFLLLALVGLYACRGRPGERGLFAAGAVALYGVVLYALSLHVGYLSRRHVLPPLLPLLAYAGVGVPLVGRALLAPLGRMRASGRWAVAVALALVACLALPKGFADRSAEREAEREAGEWLGARGQLRGPVAAAHRRVAYYAGERFVSLSPLFEGGGLEGLGDARFVIADEERLAACAALDADEIARLRLLHRVEREGRSTVVLRIEPAPAAAPGAP
jgi:hypothetical protein